MLFSNRFAYIADNKSVGLLMDLYTYSLLYASPNNYYTYSGLFIFCTLKSRTEKKNNPNGLYFLTLNIKDTRVVLLMEETIFY